MATDIGGERLVESRVRSAVRGVPVLLILAQAHIHLSTASGYTKALLKHKD